MGSVGYCQEVTGSTPGYFTVR